MTTDWKTTITGIVTGICLIVANFGFQIDAQVQTIIIAVGVAIMGFFSKDGK